MLLELRDAVFEALVAALDDVGATVDEREADLVELNEFDESEKGLLAAPVGFRLASELGRAPPEIAADVADALRDRELPASVDRVESVAGYVNVHVDEDAFATALLESVLAEGAADPAADGERVVFEFSSPNIAKPLHIGHLRNTVLGDVLANVLEARGHSLVRDNHLGDWGVQFGHLIHQYREHGDPEAFERDPVGHLLDLYQRYGQREAELEAAGDEEALEAFRDVGRDYFARIEAGDEEAVALWERFREASVERFERTYDRLGVSFDHWLGEGFYVREGWTDRVVEAARERGAAVESDGALVLPVFPEEREGVEDPETASVVTDPETVRERVDADEEYDELVLLKRDGSTTYGTRDLATVAYREAEFDADRSLYVVGSEQRDYFEQVFVAARRLGYDEQRFAHVDYGLISLPEGSMSTREGRMVTAEEVLDAVYEEARAIVEESRPELAADERERIAEQVALGAVRFENVATSRNKNVTFDVETATSLEGDTGPYVQYAATRARNILEKAEEAPPDPAAVADQPFDEYDYALAHRLARYPLALERAEERYDPAPLAHYLLDLASTFNKFYHENRVLDDEESRERRLALTAATSRVFEHALDLAGIPHLDQM